MFRQVLGGLWLLSSAGFASNGVEHIEDHIPGCGAMFEPTHPDYAIEITGAVPGFGDTRAVIITDHICALLPGAEETDGILLYHTSQECPIPLKINPKIPLVDDNGDVFFQGHRASASGKLHVTPLANENRIEVGGQGPYPSLALYQVDDDLAYVSFTEVKPHPATGTGFVHWQVLSDSLLLLVTDEGITTVVDAAQATTLRTQNLPQAFELVAKKHGVAIDHLHSDNLLDLPNGVAVPALLFLSKDQMVATRSMMIFDAETDQNHLVPSPGLLDVRKIVFEPTRQTYYVLYLSMFDQEPSQLVLGIFDRTFSRQSFINLGLASGGNLSVAPDGSSVLVRSISKGRPSFEYDPETGMYEETHSVVELMAHVIGWDGQVWATSVPLENPDIGDERDGDQFTYLGDNRWLYAWVDVANDKQAEVHFHVIESYEATRVQTLTLDYPVKPLVRFSTGGNLLVLDSTDLVEEDEPSSLVLSIDTSELRDRVKAAPLRKLTPLPQNHPLVFSKDMSVKERLLAAEAQSKTAADGSLAGFKASLSLYVSQEDRIAHQVSRYSLLALFAGAKPSISYGGLDVAEVHGENLKWFEISGRPKYLLMFLDELAKARFPYKLEFALPLKTKRWPKPADEGFEPVQFIRQ